MGKSYYIQCFIIAVVDDGKVLEVSDNVSYVYNSVATYMNMKIFSPASIHIIHKFP